MAKIGRFETVPLPISLCCPPLITRIVYTTLYNPKLLSFYTHTFASLVQQRPHDSRLHSTVFLYETFITSDSNPPSEQAAAK